MTDYIAREIETDRLADQVAWERERVTVLLDETNDIPLEQAIKMLQAEARKIEAMG